MASNFQVKTGADLVWVALIEYILTSDDVQGDPADVVLGSNLTGKINQVIQALVDNLNYLDENAFTSLPDASVTVKGVAEIANQSEGRAGTDNTRIMTALRVLDLIRNGTNVIATESRKGTLEIADQTQRRAASSNALAMTPSGTQDALRSGAGFEANESRKGVSQRASLSDVTTGTEDNEFVTPKLLKDGEFLRAQTSQATLSVSSGTITIRKNLQIDDLVFMVVENTGAASIAAATTWTLGGEHGECLASI